jgi:uncharacterized membrane protein
MSGANALHNVKSEIKMLGIGFVALVIILFVAFSKSTVLEVLRTAFALYWIFVLPGYALSLCSRQGFVERLIIGIGVQTAVFGLLSYYFGLAGWHIATHGIVLPLFSIIFGMVIWQRGRRNEGRH